MANGARTATRGAKRPRRMLDSSSSEGGSRDRKGLVCVCVFFFLHAFLHLLQGLCQPFNVLLVTLVPYTESLRL